MSRCGRAGFRVRRAPFTSKDRRVQDQPTPCQKQDYQSNALTEQAYLNNKNRFETVDLDDLKSLYPELDIVHLTVDTRHDFPEDWYVIEVEKR